MSLLPTRVVERAVPTESGSEIGVRCDRGSLVVVRWPCGDTRTFKADDLRDALAQLKLVSAHEDVWLDGSDYNGSRYCVRVDDDVLQAGAHREDAMTRIPWRSFRKALTQALG